MNFAAAASLIWIAPLAGIILALYLLKMKRRDVRVPAKFLWPSEVTDVRANSLFQKLRFSWLLVLQLLITIIIIVAIARPQTLQRGLGGAISVLVIDTSASMQATDVSPSRMAAAVTSAESLIAQAKPGDRISLIEAGPTPRIVFSNSSDIPKMRRLLKEIRPTDAESDIGEALRLASSIVLKQQSAKIVLFSDGVFSEIEDFSPGNAEVSYLKFGNSGTNVAISALGVSSSDTERFLYVGIKNYGLDTASGSIRIQSDGKLIDSFDWNARPNQVFGKTIQVPAESKVFEAFLGHKDFLESDNYSALVDDRGTSIRALLVSAGNPFLERALALDPRVRLEKATSIPASGSWDLIVYDGVEEGLLEAKAVIAFGNAGRRSPVARIGSVSSASPSDFENHPLLKNVDLTETYLDRAETTTLKAGAQSIADFTSGGNTYPLIATSNSGGTRRIYVAFPPMESDFPLQVGFPIFISNALDYLLPPLARSSSLSLVPGQNVSLPANSLLDLKVITPDKSEISVKPSHGRYVIREIIRTGKYRIAERSGYASLRSEVESSIAPSDSLKVTGTPVKATTGLAQISDSWRLFVAFALALLCLEWWVFLRRS